MSGSCPLCASLDHQPFFELRGVPCHIGILWPDAESAAACPRGDLLLSVCRGCGFMWNRAFDPAQMDYSVEYDNTLHFSAHYRQYAAGVARDLVARHALEGKVIVEIGSGKGEFLNLLCDLGDNRGFGFDPSYDGRFDDSAGGRVTFVREFFTVDHGVPDPDLVVSRYVFEHVPHPRDFLATVRESLHGRRATVYFEVPNANLFLRDGSPWDIIYEHCSYFVPSTLRLAFERCGFEVSRVEEQYDGQMIGIEASPGPSEGKPSPERVVELVRSAEAFGDGFSREVSRWRSWEAELDDAGRSAAVWGAGAKAVSFLNLLSRAAPITAVVDVNPAKHGKFVPGAGWEIVAPEMLRERAPDEVLIMNPVYEAEIRAMLDTLGLSPEVRFAF